MKRKLPDYIEIGGHIISITRVKDLLDTQEAYGLFDPTHLKIEIDSSLNNTMAWETLWHEVVEAINFFSEAGIEHKSIQVFGLLLHEVAKSMFTFKRGVGKTTIRAAAKRKTTSV